LDDANLLLVEKDSKFMNFIESLLEECQNIKVLLTCRDYTSQPSSSEQTLEIPGLYDSKDESKVKSFVDPIYDTESDI